MIEDRVAALEVTVQGMSLKVDAIYETVTNVQTVSNAVTFARKYGPKLVHMLIGGLTVAGMGNPKILHLITEIFES